MPSAAGLTAQLNGARIHLTRRSRAAATRLDTRRMRRGGDVMPCYSRNFGIGPLIGKRTWGGLVRAHVTRVLLDEYRECAVGDSDPKIACELFPQTH